MAQLRSREGVRLLLRLREGDRVTGAGDLGHQLGVSFGVVPGLDDDRCPVEIDHQEVDDDVRGCLRVVAVADAVVPDGRRGEVVDAGAAVVIDPNNRGNYPCCSCLLFLCVDAGRRSGRISGLPGEL